MRCLLFVCLVALAAVVFAQENPPNLEGRYNDEVCHAIPMSRGLYQRRTMVFGAWSNELQEGNWTEIINVYPTQDCNQNFEFYRITQSGVYTITGKESDYLSKFWHVEYGINNRTMEPFSQQFISLVEDDPSCEIEGLIPFVVTSIRRADCSTLGIVPLKKCPVLYDITRKEENRIWVGTEYPGDPVYWKPACTKQDRPKDYDIYTLSTTVAGSPPVVNLNQYLNNTNADTSFFQDTTNLGFSSGLYEGIERDDALVNSGNNLQIMISLVVCVIAFLL